MDSNTPGALQVLQCPLSILISVSVMHPSTTNHYSNEDPINGCKIGPGFPIMLVK
jgi:hypothetical protein